MTWNHIMNSSRFTHEFTHEADTFKFKYVNERLKVNIISGNYLQDNGLQRTYSFNFNIYVVLK